VRFEQKTLGIEGIAHTATSTLNNPCSLNDKLTLLFELRQDRRSRSVSLVTSYIFSTDENFKSKEVHICLH